MKRYIQFLIYASIIISIACAVKDYYSSQPVSADTAYNHLHKEIDNREQSWNTILVNNWNRIPDDFNISLKKTENGEKVDSRIYPYLEEMLTDAKSNGYCPEITSGFRSEKEQKQLFDNRIEDYVSSGYSRKEAKKLANQYVAKSGYSEHETGLAVDINSTDGNSWNLYGWLKDNCFKYGFIVRYPDGKEDITGIKYEPWHLRYVGKDIAKYIYENNITLEEYLFSQII